MYGLNFTFRETFQSWASHWWAHYANDLCIHFVHVNVLKRSQLWLFYLQKMACLALWMLELASFTFSWILGGIALIVERRQWWPLWRHIASGSLKSAASKRRKAWDFPRTMSSLQNNGDLDIWEPSQMIFRFLGEFSERISKRIAVENIVKVSFYITRNLISAKTVPEWILHTVY